MSEYQYYEFQAIDRQLSEADREALRALSTRARITATSFTNHYEWGDFKGEPRQLMGRWFDLHLYLTNWGTRRLMMRLPKRLVERSKLEAFLRNVEWVEVGELGGNLIVDMYRDDVEQDYDNWEDGSGWLGALAPLRADVLSGDLRLFYLLWLTALEDGMIEADETEPLAGIGPLTGALNAAAEFFDIDRDLVTAAAERPDGAEQAIPEGVSHDAVSGLSNAEMTDLLMRVVDGDPHVAAEIKQIARTGEDRPVVDFCTVAHLQARAAALSEERKRTKAERLAEIQRRRKEEAVRARRKRLDALAHKGEAVWAEIETEIMRCNASGYDRAAALLCDLKAIADEQETTAEFTNRLASILDRHARKKRFLERLTALT